MYIIHLGTPIKTGRKIIHRGGYAQEKDPVRGICGVHGRHETAEVRAVLRTDGGRGLRGGGAGKEWMGCLWTASELSVSTPTSGRLQPRTRRNNVRWWNKGQNI